MRSAEGIERVALLDVKVIPAVKNKELPGFHPRSFAPLPVLLSQPIQVAPVHQPFIHQALELLDQRFAKPGRQGSAGVGALLPLAKVGLKQILEAARHNAAVSDHWAVSIGWDRESEFDDLLVKKRRPHFGSVERRNEQAKQAQAALWSTENSGQNGGLQLVEVCHEGEIGASGFWEDISVNIPGEQPILAFGIEEGQASYKGCNSVFLRTGATGIADVATPASAAKGEAGPATGEARVVAGLQRRLQKKVLADDTGCRLERLVDLAQKAREERRRHLGVGVHDSGLLLAVQRAGYLFRPSDIIRSRVVFVGNRQGVNWDLIERFRGRQHYRGIDAATEEDRDAGSTRGELLDPVSDYDLDPAAAVVAAASRSDTSAKGCQ